MTAPKTKFEWLAIILTAIVCVTCVVMIAVLLHSSHQWRIERNKRDAICTQLDAVYIPLFDYEKADDAWGCYKDHQIVYYSEGDVK